MVKKRNNNYRFIIAGGGTGGHLFPGMAIAEEVMRRNPKSKILFISSGKPFEKEILSRNQFRHIAIAAAGIKRLGLRQQIYSAALIPKGIFQSIVILNKFKPDLVVGVGSYSAGPVVIGAWLMRIPVVLHEQNIIPGVTNRLLSIFARRIYVSFKKTTESFNPKKTYFTGNPIRKEILSAASGKTKGTLKKPTLFTILVLGGSQGAHALNTAVIESLPFLKDKNRYFFIHQTGYQDEERIKEGYRSMNISCRVQPFFNDMPRQYRAADLMICRAGATTVAEITGMGKSAIFIPYPYAADNHQAVNAKSLANAGAAEMILEKDLDVKLLARRIEHYASHPDDLLRMASKAGRMGKPDAAKLIMDDCLSLLNN